MTLSGEVVDLVRLCVLNNSDEVGRIGHVTVVKNEPQRGVMRVLIKVIDPPSIEGRRSPLNPMDDVALLEEEFAQISPILPRDPRDQSNTSCHEPFTPIPLPRTRAVKHQTFNTANTSFQPKGKQCPPLGAAFQFLVDDGDGLRRALTECSRRRPRNS